MDKIPTTIVALKQSQFIGKLAINLQLHALLYARWHAHFESIHSGNDCDWEHFVSPQRVNDEQRLVLKHSLRRQFGFVQIGSSVHIGSVHLVIDELCDDSRSTDDCLC